MAVWLFILQRGSALVMAPLVLIHIGVMVVAVRNGLSSEEILGRTQGSVIWGAFYGLFVLAAAVHGGIGLRAVLAETPLPRPAAGALGLVFALLALWLGGRAVAALVA
jgi:fumarate reductase subunit C